VNAIPEGQYIRHYRYGMGVVTESDAKQTSIDFDLHGLKRFVTTLMVVELSDLVPPERIRAKHGEKVYARLAANTTARSKSASTRRAHSGSRRRKNGIDGSSGNAAL
jgi:hypothetical protein